MLWRLSRLTVQQTAEGLEFSLALNLYLCLSTLYQCLLGALKHLTIPNGAVDLRNTEEKYSNLI